MVVVMVVVMVVMLSHQGIPRAAGCLERPARRPPRPRAIRQGRGEAIAADQHELGRAEQGLLAGLQPEGMGIVAGAQQALHPQIACGQPLGQIAENPVGRHHHRCRRIGRAWLDWVLPGLCSAAAGHRQDDAKCQPRQGPQGFQAVGGVVPTLR
jgi:hypothetical protein